jgi:hypothetical protein
VRRKRAPWGDRGEGEWVSTISPRWWHCCSDCWRHLGRDNWECQPGRWAGLQWVEQVGGVIKVRKLILLQQVKKERERAAFHGKSKWHYQNSLNSPVTILCRWSSITSICRLRNKSMMSSIKYVPVPYIHVRTCRTILYIHVYT